VCVHADYMADDADDQTSDRFLEVYPVLPYTLHGTWSVTLCLVNSRTIRFIG
jgi:hypothetical protein